MEVHTGGKSAPAVSQQDLQASQQDLQDSKGRFKGSQNIHQFSKNAKSRWNWCNINKNQFSNESCSKLYQHPKRLVPEKVFYRKYITKNTYEIHYKHISQIYCKKIL